MRWRDVVSADWWIITAHAWCSLMWVSILFLASSICVAPNIKSYASLILMTWWWWWQISCNYCWWCCWCRSSTSSTAHCWSIRKIALIRSRFLHRAWSRIRSCERWSSYIGWPWYRASFLAHATIHKAWLRNGRISWFPQWVLSLFLVRICD